MAIRNLRSQATARNPHPTAPACASAARRLVTIASTTRVNAAYVIASKQVERLKRSHRAAPARGSRSRRELACPGPACVLGGVALSGFYLVLALISPSGMGMGDVKAAAGLGTMLA